MYQRMFRGQSVPLALIDGASIEPGETITLKPKKLTKKEAEETVTLEDKSGDN